MDLINHNLKTAISYFIYYILFIHNVTSKVESPNEDKRTDIFADAAMAPKMAENLSAPPIVGKDIDSEKNLKDSFTQNINHFEKDQYDPFVQDIVRVNDEKEDMIELNNLSRKKRFLGIAYGKDESGEARFRTLHGQDYNPYDLDEYNKLSENQYENSVNRKIRPKVQKGKTETKPPPGDFKSKVDESLKKQPNFEHQEDSHESNSAADQLKKGLPLNNNIPAKVEGLHSDIPQKEFHSENDQALSDRQYNQMSETQSSQNSVESQTVMKKSESRQLPEKLKNKHRGRTPEDSLMLEFNHNRPDSRIFWLNYPDYRRKDGYRLIDEAAERALITDKEFGFVNPDYDPMEVERLINYVDNNKKGYEVLNLEITPEWNQKSLKVRAAACKYLVNDSMMLRKYEMVYDSSQPPEQIQAYYVIVRLEIEDIPPRRLGALSCPIIQPKTSLAVTLFMTPITYVDENIDEYVFIFFQDDPLNNPSYVRLMFLSRLASGDSVEEEYMEDQRINAMKDTWWHRK